MALPCIQVGPTLAIPPAHHPGHTTAEDRFAIAAPRDTVDHTVMPNQRLQPHTALRVPHKELTYGTATPTACQASSIRTPRYAGDARFVGHKGMQQRAILGPPQPHRAIFTTTCQPLPIGAPGHIIDWASVAAAFPARRPRADVPNPHDLVTPGTRQRAAIRTPRYYAIERIGLGRDDPHAGASLSLPNAYRLVKATARQPTTI